MYGEGLETSIAEAGRLGLAGIDIWVTPNMGEHLPPDPDPAQLERVRRCLTDAGVSVAALSAYATHAYGRGLGTLPAFLELASALGAPVVVTGEGTGPRDAAPALADYLAYLAPALDRAAELQVTIALENHRGHRWLGRGEDTIELFTTCDHPALGLALAHHHIVTEDSDPSAVVDALFDRIALVYAWDWATTAAPPRHWKDPTHQFIGAGDLPWDDYLSQLVELGYQGPAVIFAHGCEEIWDTARTSAEVARVRDWITARLPR